MEQLIVEYFKFNGKGKKDIKIIDELNPNKIIKNNITKFIDKNLFNNKIDSEVYDRIFNIDYDIYERILNKREIGDYLNGNHYQDSINKFVNKFMINNKFPVNAKFNPIIYNIYTNNTANIINEDYGIFLYNTIIENKFNKILEISSENDSSGIFICTALKNLELYDYKTIYTSINLSKKIENINLSEVDYNNIEIIKEINYIALPDLLKKGINNEKITNISTENNHHKTYDMIIINGKNSKDFIINFFYSDLLLNINGLIILNLANINAKDMEKNISSNYTNYKKEESDLGTWQIYRKIKE